MFTRCIGILLVISLLLITSCTSAEHKEALRLYQSAISSKNIHQRATALTTLAKLAPEKYQAELTKVKKAKALLLQAQQYQAQNDDYSAYLSSHASYRSIPSVDGKKILVSTGKVLLPFLKAQLNIDKYFQFLPKKLTPLFNKYSELPVSNWDLIKVNKVVEQLSKAVIELNNAIALLENEKVKTMIPDVSLWKKSLENRLYITVQARNYFANLARYRSARILFKLNDKLTFESSNLLSLVRPKLAQESMQSSFQKAQSEYADFQNITANISLAENLNVKDIHAIWYKNWQSLELATLEPKDEFANYPINSSNRDRLLTAFINEKKIRIPVLTESFYDKAEMNQEYHQLTKLTDALKKDKALLL